MERADFEHRVRRAVESRLTPESVEYAIRHYVQHVGRLDYESVRHCVMLAGLFDASSHASTQPASQAVDHHLTSERAITTEARIRRIRPWIELLREVLFGHATAHCTSLASAGGWLRNVLRQAYDWSPEAAASYLPEEIRPLVLDSLSTEEGPGEYLSEHLRYLREALRAGDTEACMRAALAWNEGDPPLKLPPLLERLNWVNIQLSDIAQAIGCSDAEILAYALASIRPTVPPVTIATRRYVHTPPGDTQPMQRTEVTITVRSRLTFVELREISRQLGQILNVTKAKPLSAEDKKFIEVVEQIEGAPVGEGSKAFWEQFLLQWNGMEGVQSYTNWRNPQRRYTRLMERLKQVAA